MANKLCFVLAILGLACAVGQRTPRSDTRACVLNRAWERAIVRVMIRDRIVGTVRLETNQQECIELDAPDDVHYRVRFMARNRWFVSERLLIGEGQHGWLEIEQRPNEPVLWTYLRAPSAGV